MIKRLTKLSAFLFVVSFSISNSFAQSSGLTFSTNSRVTIPSTSSLDLGKGAFTLEAILKVSTSATGTHTILSNRVSSEESGLMWGIYGGRPYLQLGGVLPNFGFDQGVSIADGKCHHVAVTRNASGALKLYLDGQKYYESASTNSSNSTGNFYLGYDARNDGNPFDGSMDEVRIWKVERSAADLAAYAAKGLPNPKNQTGLVALWDLNEGAGQTTTDASASGLNATLGATANMETTDPSWSKVGCVTDIAKTGAALVFSGTQKVTVPENTQLNLGTGTFTFEATIKAFRTGSGNQVILSNRGVGTKGLMFGLYNGHLFAQLGGDVPNIGAEINSADLRDSVCHHVAITRNANNLLQFFLDGTIFYEATSAGNITGTNFSISQDARNGSSFFKGIIDEIRIWNVYRTEAQIKSTYNTALANPATQAGLVALWDFDDKSGQLVKDKSKNDITAILGSTDAVEANDPTWTTEGCLAPVVTDLKDQMIATAYTVYPNPFEDQLFISSNAGIVTASLYTATGERVMSEMSVANQSAFKVDSNLPSGMYLLKVANGIEARFYKVVKK